MSATDQQPPHRAERVGHRDVRVVMTGRGRALVDQARAALVAEGIVRPDRVVAMFVPVTADARRI